MSLRDDQLATLKVAGKDFDYYNIANLDGLDHLPYSLKVLVENLVRNIDGANITDEHVKTLLDWDPNAEPSHEIQFTPSRVIMQDFTGVPCIVDLATMRDAVKDLGGDPEVINPQVQSDMVIDHSVQIDKYGIANAVQKNMDIEYQRNGERYQFLRWGQQAFKNFRVVPPGTGIIHQVNIEYLAKVVMSKTAANGNTLAYLDSCVGTDSHTTTENGLGVLGWGVGGIEAEAASVPLANRATIGNMGPEFGSTCGIFPIDNVTLDYLRLTGRSEEQVALVEAYAKANKLWGDASDPDYVEPQYSEYEELDLGAVVPSIAGPKRPQDRILLSEAKEMFEKTAPAYETEKTVKDPVAVSTDFRGDFDIENGDVAIASITSCTNTSNPSVMIAAGLIARNAHAKGLKPKPWVKTSLAPGSQVVADYLKAAGLQDDLDALGYQLVGFGCATCIGNSGPLLPEISEAINTNDLTVTAVLSGNRNFEGRISPDVKMNYLASPPLVIAYALAGTMDFDFETQPLGTDADGNDVYLKDIWPTNSEVAAVVDGTVSREMFLKDYASVFDGDHRWKGLDVPEGELFAWNDKSTYVRKQTFFDGMKATPDPVASPAGKYLTERGVEPKNFNSYGSRRGNHEIMVRGTFGNIRLRNQLLASVGEEVTSGGFTYDFLAKKLTTIFEASRDYIDNKVPLVVLAGKEYGTGSSRDWAAKGTVMLGVKAVITESFERIHRSNLIGMGVLPLQFPAGESYESLGLNGTETYDIAGVEKLNEGVTPKTVHVTATHEDGSKTEFDAVVRIDTPGEADYYRNGGILQYVLRNLMK